MNKIMMMGILENIVTLICMTVLVLGLYYMGASWWSAIPGLLVFNLSSVKYKETESVNYPEKTTPTGEFAAPPKDR